MGPLSCAGPAPAKSLGGTGALRGPGQRWSRVLGRLLPRLGAPPDPSQGPGPARLGWDSPRRLGPSRPTHLRLRCSPVPPQQPRGGLPGTATAPTAPSPGDWLLAAQSESTLRGPVVSVRHAGSWGHVGNAPAPCIAASQARVAGTGSRALGSRGTGLILPARLACPAGCPRSGSRPCECWAARSARGRLVGGSGGPGTPRTRLPRRAAPRPAPVLSAPSSRLCVRALAAFHLFHTATRAPLPCSLRLPVGRSPHVSQTFFCLTGAALKTKTNVSPAPQLALAEDISA